MLKKIINRLVNAALPSRYKEIYWLRARLYEHFLSAKTSFDIMSKLVESNAFFKPSNITVKNTPNASNILIFAPHQDDDIIGCGGTILNSLAKEINVSVVYMMDGISPKIQDIKRSEMLHVRNAEAKQVWSHLNNHNPMFLNIPTRSNSVETKKYIHKIVEILNGFDGECIFLPYFLDAPLDHQRATFLIWKALKNSRSNALREIWLYQVNTMISPNIAIDITDVESKKFELMGMWESQNQAFNYQHRTRGLNAANSVYTMFSIKHDQPYVELFHVTSPTNFINLLSPYYEQVNLF
tara:strand:- start:9679 stop:10566 length:888 start_codon:yes stop_codon:yes gene_type:complete